MPFCLIKPAADKFKKALKEGKINPVKLAEATSQARRNVFAEIVGEEYATQVNALFESKLLLKNQQQGMITWAKGVSGITKQAKRDLISRIERMTDILTPETEQAFLNDLVNQKLGLKISSEEAKVIAELSDKAMEAKKFMNKDFTFDTEEHRFQYGTAVALMEKYIDTLKTGTVFKGKGVKEGFFTLAGTFKSLKATFDNSFFGRQGIKLLYLKPTIWAKSFIKSWGDMGKEIMGHDAMIPINADIYSRPNAINGKYRAMGLDVGMVSKSFKAEEQFPSQLPEKIPGLGRVFKAVEAAYNGAARRMRADYGDIIAKSAEKSGINMLNSVEARGIGKLINSTTGRGSIGRLESIGGEINASVFSIKFFKSNFDTLTAHMLDKTTDPFVRKQAAKNLLRIIGTIYTILFLSELLQPGSVEWDPRSADYGKIKIGKRRINITGGMNSLVTAGSRVLPTMHNGKWGWWVKSSTTGRYYELNKGDFGSRDVIDVIYDFIEGKLSPIAGMMRDMLRQQTFLGERLTIQNTIENLVVPMSLDTFDELMEDPEGGDITIWMILDALGFAVNVY